MSVDVGEHIRAEGEAEVARRAAELSEDPEWTAIYDRSLEAQGIRLSAALRALVWSLIGSLPGPFRRAAEQRVS